MDGSQCLRSLSGGTDVIPLRSHPQQDSAGALVQYRYQDSQGRTSEDGRSENRDSVPSKSGVAPLTTVSEHGPARPDSRRASNTHTFGNSDGEPNSREHSFSVERKGLSHSTAPSPSPTPSLAPPTPRFSVADSDALRRQSLRSNKPSQSGDANVDLEKGDVSEKQNLPPLRTSEEVPRNSSVHRLTLNTTNDSSTGYVAYESSHGHSEYWKKP